MAVECQATAMGDILQIIALCVEDLNSRNMENTKNILRAHVFFGSGGLVRAPFFGSSTGNSAP